MANAIVKIQIVADYFEGKPVYEAVPATKIGENRYRLEGSPGLAPGVASGDEIELAPSERVGYRVLKRSGNVCVQLFLKRRNRDDQRQIEKIVEGAGGWLDGGGDAPGGQLLVFTIPVGVGFEAIEKAMTRISEGFPVERWMYGNVYSTRDGVTPLNWWLEADRLKGSPSPGRIGVKS